jgi:tryptophan-rich sensory protein
VVADIFALRAYLAAFIWLMLLWVLVLAMIIAFRAVDERAAWLQVPYFIWLSFAAYLSLGVYLLNR